MNKLVSIFIILSLTGCLSHNQQSKATDIKTIETAFLGFVDLDPKNHEAIELKQLVLNKTKFGTTPPFDETFEPVADIPVFGHRLIAIEFCDRWDDLTASIAYVEGTSTNVSEYISERYKIQFIQKEKHFHSRFDDGFTLSVFQDSGNTTAIYGIYEDRTLKQ